MTSSWFDSSLTSKTLNLFLLLFNERSKSENLGHSHKAWITSLEACWHWSQVSSTITLLRTSWDLVGIEFRIAHHNKFLTLFWIAYPKLLSKFSTTGVLWPTAAWFLARNLYPDFTVYTSDWKWAQKSLLSTYLRHKGINLNLREK